MTKSEDLCHSERSEESPEILRFAQDDSYIETRNLTLSYRGKRAFERISLSLDRGSLTALIGPSGCGKTSFLSCLNRLTDLIPGCRVDGKITIGGEDIRNPKINVTRLRRRVGMIFQKPNPFPISIRKNLELPLKECCRLGKTEMEQRIESVLRSVNLWDEVKDRLNTSALALSGGQQQRLCMARALALDPEVLLMDEPCSALDPISSGIVEDLIAGLREHYTVLIVTHNLAQARRIADNVALFWVQDGVGRLVEYSGAKQIFESPEQEVTAAYINGIRG